MVQAPKSRLVRGVYSENPNDIDVSIVYDKQYVSVEDAIAYRHKLAGKFFQLNSMTIDTILLSKKEDKEVGFLANAKNLEF